MPIYDFACADCGHRFEQMCEMSAAAQLKCPSCGSSTVNKLVSMPGLIRTADRAQGGQTCCGRSERCDTPPCSSGGQCQR